jgi:hypothetical protein
LQCPIYKNCAVVGYGTQAQAQASVEGHGGCVASSPASREPMTSLVGAGGLLGLFAFRIAGVRRRASKKK